LEMVIEAAYVNLKPGFTIKIKRKKAVGEGKPGREGD